MNQFLEKEIKEDLDLIKEHIEKTENKLLNFNMKKYYPEGFIHLYETYERLMHICADNPNSKNEESLDFYITRRDILYNIKNNLKNGMNCLFNISEKHYKKLIYTYENVIKQYKTLYKTVRYLEVKIIKEIDIQKVDDIDYIEIKSHKLAKEIVNGYNNSFSKTINGKFTSFNYNVLKVVFDNSIGLGFELQDKFIPIKLNEDIEFNIVFRK